MRGRIGPPVIRATVFRAASHERWEDAQCLYKAGRYQGAIYLCGYALECRLKFSVCTARGVNCLEEIEAKSLGHDLERSMQATGLYEELYKNKDLIVAFLRIVRQWSTEIRYSGAPRGRQESEKFLRDTRALLRWLETRSKL
jgi:hypothetical protein